MAIRRSDTLTTPVGERRAGALIAAAPAEAVCSRSRAASLGGLPVSSPSGGDYRTGARAAEMDAVRA
jgi:hypothetical protein